MNIIFAAVALATAQAAPAAPVDHSQHNAAQQAPQPGQHQPGQHTQHDGEHKCCKEVNGKMECQMMKGHGAPNQGQGGKQDHQGHVSSH